MKNKVKKNFYTGVNFYGIVLALIFTFGLILFMTSFELTVIIITAIVVALIMIAFLFLLEHLFAYTQITDHSIIEGVFSKIIKTYNCEEFEHIDFGIRYRGIPIVMLYVKGRDEVPAIIFDVTKKSLSLLKSNDNFNPLVKSRLSKVHLTKFGNLRKDETF